MKCRSWGGERPQDQKLCPVALCFFFCMGPNVFIFPSHLLLFVQRKSISYISYIVLGTESYFYLPVQVGKSGHSSVEDAQATMELYKLVEVEWEQHLVQNPPKD